MIVSEKAWTKYVDALAKINKTAAATMKAYLQKHGYTDTAAIIQFAFSLAIKYGEAAAALACEMYDELAQMSGIYVPAAEPADVATEDEVASTVENLSHNSPVKIPPAIARLVKRSAADTMLKNASRDGAEFAWIPHGDTCAYCLFLASVGWRKAGKKTLNGTHAEHIHGNCNCEYAVRFDEKTEFQGYDPDFYQELYDHAEGNNPTDKINSIRRAQYAQNAPKINAQKRQAYAARKELLDAPKLFPLE